MHLSGFLLPFCLLVFSVFADDLDSGKYLAVRSTLHFPPLVRRQSCGWVCNDANPICCPDVEGSCCPDGTTSCASSDASNGYDCVSGDSTCTGSDQEVCGQICCTSPYVCEKSTLLCVRSGITLCNSYLSLAGVNMAGQVNLGFLCCVGFVALLLLC